MLALDGDKIRNFDLDWAVNQSKTVSLKTFSLQICSQYDVFSI